MSITLVRKSQIRPLNIIRSDINTTTSGSALITKVIAGAGLTLSSTGVNPGTGDVTITLSIASASVLGGVKIGSGLSVAVDGTISVSSITWGSITGTLSSQTDLQNALNAKYNNPTGTVSQYIDGTGAYQTFPSFTFSNQLSHEVKAGVAINIGQPVYVTGADGTNMIVGLASNASEATSSKTIGLLNTTVSTNGMARVITEGLLAGLNTSGANAAGDPVWLGVNGALIYGLINKPVAPAHLVFIGIVTRKNANNGEIFVKVQNGFEMKELHDYVENGVQNNYVIAYESSTSLYKPKSIATLLGYTAANDANVVHTTGNESIAGIKTFSDTTQSTSVLSGAVVVNGGVGITKNLYVGGDINIAGNLTIGGTSTIINAQNLSVSDNMIYLNNGIQTTITNVVGNGSTVVYTTLESHNYTTGMIVTISGVSPSVYNLIDQTITAVSTNSFTITFGVVGLYVSGGTARAKTSVNPDLGFAGGYNDGSYAHTGLFRDATDNTWKFFKGYTLEPDASPFIDTSHGSFAYADLRAYNITGNSFVKVGGTSVQFLKADGSIDSNTYATQTYVTTAISQIPSPTISVQQVNIAGTATESYSGINILQFDEDSGFDVTNPSAGIAKVAMNSTFKYWKVDGVQKLTAVGLDTVNFLSGSGISITANGSASPQELTISSTDTLASVTGRGASTSTAITSTAVRGFYINSGTASYFEANSTSDWAFYRLSNNATVTWDIASLSGGPLELRPYGSGTNAVSIGLDGRISANHWTTTGRNYSYEWLEFPNASGLYSQINGAHFYPNTATSYGAWAIQGTRNSYGGLSFTGLTNGSVSLMIHQNSNITGFLNSAYDWQFYWGGGTLYVSKTNYGGGTLATVLDSSNYNTYAPTLTGTGASGNWGINITGNAQYFANNYIGTANANSIWRAGSYTFFNGVNVPVGDFGLISFPTWSSTDANSRYNLQLGSQIGGPLLYRSTNINGAASWATMLSDANYNSYSPTLTGVGASGTWGINVTGTAGALTSMNISQFTNDSGYLTSLPSHNHDDRYYTETESDARFQPLENQRLSTSNSVTFSEIYANNWFRNIATNTGLYNQANANHFYSRAGTQWAITSNGSTNGSLMFYRNHETVLEGQVYFDTSGFGLLNRNADWAVRSDRDNTSVRLYHSGIEKFRTDASGAYVTGRLDVTSYIYTPGAITAKNLQSPWQTLDLDTPKEPGLYNYDGTIGGTQPAGTNWYNVRTIEIGAGARYSQFVMPYSVDRIFYRRQADAGWQSYVELIHSANITSFAATPTQGTQGATAYSWGNHAGLYLPLTGNHTRTGTVYNIGTFSIGQNTNGTAVIDAYGTFAYFGCNTASNGMAIGPSGAATFSSSITATSGLFSSTGVGVFNSQLTINNTTSASALITFQNTINGFAFGFSSTGTGGQRFSFFNGAPTEIAYITATGAATFSSSVTATSFSNAGLQSGEVFNATKSNAGYFVGYLQNTSATGYGLYIQNGTDSLPAIRIGNAAGTINAINLYGSGAAEFSSTVTATSFSGGVYPYNSILGSGADASTGTVFAGSTNGYVSSINVAGGGATNPNTIIFKTASVERLRINTNITDLTGSFNISEKLGVTGVASVGAKKLSMGILDLNTGVTPTQFKIKTNIPWNYGGSDFTVNIKGFRYGASQMVSLSIGWHYYNSEFYSRNAISNGAWSPIITLAKSSDGFVIIHLPDPGYWAKMYVESVFSSNSSDSYTTGWSWTDADLSDCTLIQTVPYRDLATNISGNSATTSQTNFATLTLNSAAVATQSWVQSQAYLTTYTDTLASVTGRGATTSVPITITGSEGREVAVYIPSSYTTDDLVSGHEYGWYSDHWRLGMTRSGGAAGADFVVQWNGTRKFSLTNSGDITITGTISTVAGNSTQWNTAYGWGNHASAGYATTAYVTTQINNLIDAAPGALDTLNELAAALGDDPNFATTVTSSIAGKVSKAGDVITTSNNYGLVIDHTLALGDFVDALLIRSTTSGQRAQMGFATVDTDGNHHRASIRAYKGAGSLEGVFGIAVRQATSGTHIQRLTLDYLGNLTIGGALTESSSFKLKENINTITGNLEKVLDLRPVAYNKIGSTIKELGLIAEEVAETYPEFVQYDENGEAIGVNYSRLTTVLIGAVKELSDKIKKLETK